MSEDADHAVLFAPGLGGLGRVLDPRYRSVAFPEGDLKGFAEGPGRGVRAFVTFGDRPVEPEIAALPNLGLVAVMGSGFEGVDVKGLRARGVDVTHSPNANHEDVADHAVGLMIAQVRRLAAGDRTIRGGDWVKRQAAPTRSIRTLKVGVVGLGAIGAAVADRLRPFGCQIAWWGPRSKPNVPYRRVDTLLELAQESDVLIAAHRADDSNKGLISKAVIEALGPKGVLVNITRGSAVDEDALILALKAGTLGGAALDVFEMEPTPAERWRDVPNVILTPHTAGGGDASIAAMIGMVRDNLSRFFAGKPLATPVPKQD